jgi:predicted permease
VSLLDVLVSTVLPVLVVAAVGVALGRAGVDGGPLNTVTLYVFAPALVFDSLLTAPVPGGTAARLLLALAAFTAAMLLVAAGAARALGETGATRSALLLCVAFPNVGNFGIPVATFAYGALGRSAAVLITVGQNVVLYTLGIYVAAGGERSARAALDRVVRQPLLYAVVLAGALLAAGVVPAADGTLMRTVGMVGDAAIPLFLVVLGIELAEVAPDDLRRPLPAVGLKLAVAPAVGAAVALAVGLSGDAARTFVIETAAPTAVTPLLFFVEFADDPAAPRYVSAAVFLGMLGAVPTVTVLLVLLEGAF